MIESFMLAKIITFVSLVHPGSRASMLAKMITLVSLAHP